MNYFKILPILLLTSVLALNSCKDGGNEGKEEANESMEVPTTTPSPQDAPTAEPAQNAAGIWHYTCAKGCAGGGGTAGSMCATCGGPLAHNQAYHASASPTTTSTTTPPVGTPPAGTPPPTAEPAQNAKGVWHYTCGKGCTGGAGVASAMCSTCGGPLAHNQIYHQ